MPEKAQTRFGGAERAGGGVGKKLGVSLFPITDSHFHLKQCHLDSQTALRPLDPLPSLRPLQYARFEINFDGSSQFALFSFYGGAAVM